MLNEVCQMPSSTSGSVRKLHLNRGDWRILSSIPRWLSIKNPFFLLPESRPCIRIPGTKSLPGFLCLNLKLIYYTTFSTSKPRHCIVIQFLSGTRVLCQSSVPKVFWCPLSESWQGPCIQFISPPWPSCSEDHNVPPIPHLQRTTFVGGAQWFLTIVVCTYQSMGFTS